MRTWFESIVGPELAQPVMWTVIVLGGLIVLLIVLRVLRGFSSGTFVMGGRNRKARLAVMDATAVDATRRLVLVRRDDVQHLILIGGPTDVVVEQNIRPYAPPRQHSEQEPFISAPPAAPRAARAPMQETAPRAAERPAPPPQRPVAAAPTPAPAPVPMVAQAPEIAAPAPQAAYAPTVSPAPLERPIVPPVAPPLERSFPSAPVSTRVEPALDLGAHDAPRNAAPSRRDDEDLAMEEEMNRMLTDFSAEPKR